LAKKSVKEQTIGVVRDTTFSRSVADSVAVVHLGRDMEFSFLQEGQIVTSVVNSIEGDHATAKFLNLEPAITEVARIRMSPQSAMMMSLHIFEKLIPTGMVDTEALSQALKNMVAKANEVTAT
jgi:hypothetical protein